MQRDKYSYSYEFDEFYCYKGSNTLKNKLGITDDATLNEAERKLVLLRVDELLAGSIEGALDSSHLKAIHRHLFQDLYEWAGLPRTVAIAKTNLFCLPQYIDSAADDIFRNLKKHKYFLDLDYGATLDALVSLFADVNALHPFREGNGRAQREFIEELAKINGVNLDLTTVESFDMIVASHESATGDYTKLKEMFNHCAAQLATEEQKQYIELYCTEKLKNVLLGYLA